LEIFEKFERNALVAQWIERHGPNVEDVGSTPTESTNLKGIMSIQIVTCDYCGGDRIELDSISVTEVIGQLLAGTGVEKLTSTLSNSLGNGNGSVGVRPQYAGDR
jgi:hypothetical protein